ncbi:hypothetical protein DV736_g4661, partial [Chaetothyriales sp. CBS 134916]
MAIQDYNPFAKREEFSSSNLLAYKVLTIITWLLVVISGAYYSVHAPEDCKAHHHCHTIWGQNKARPTPFALNSVVTDIYWIITVVLQAHYLRYLWSSDTSYLYSAANVGSHFILNNLFIFAFIMLWVRGHFWPGEVILVANFFNLTSLYFRHPTTPLFVHIPIVSAPYAWNYVAILWDGAAMVNARSLPARILANLAIWGILVLGAFFILTFKDYSMGFELAILSLSLAIAQLGTHVIAFQWIFAFVIFGCLIVLSLLVGVPGLFGEKGVRQEGAVVDADRERAPLLDEAQA